MLDERVYSISCWFITIHWQTVYCIALVALNFTDKMEFMYSCLHPKVYHEKLAPIHESLKETCVPVQLVHDFWHMFFHTDLVYTTGGPPDFIVVLLIICYH